MAITIVVVVRKRRSDGDMVRMLGGQAFSKLSRGLPVIVKGCGGLERREIFVGASLLAIPESTATTEQPADLIASKLAPTGTCPSAIYTLAGIAIDGYRKLNPSYG
ncbi:hypothetical protein [Pseudomonas schmalbachii]|uniref:Uncharacterized protein n=1 Tax=Pseudomonas schmalbachii TaxID=2816993 RepID=A0ABS3TTR2_9PSED|nr:hypothetical protein [Pseudomonas schmalbachii]MBO3275969.1 hypothetical protein [Pseudomonas schmalbachii]